MRLALALLVLVLVLGAGLAALAFGTERGRHILRGLKAEGEVRRMVAALPGVTRQAGLWVEMPDGVRLATDLYLPQGAGPWPTILVRLPYGKTRYWEARHWVRTLAPRGYAVAVQDMRGRWGSEGVFAPWPNAGPDGVATLDWIVAQPWSDGQVGTIGCSALGEHQFALAAERHPAHRAMVALGAGGAAGEVEGLWNFFGMWEGGIWTLAPAYGWFGGLGGKTAAAMHPVALDHARGLATLPVREAVATARADPTDYEALLDGFADPVWRAGAGYMNGGERFDTPALLGDTWFDHSVHATLALRRLIARSAEAHAIVWPGTHCDFAGPFRSGHVADYAVARDPGHDPDAPLVAFLDHHLKGGPDPELPAVRVYELGADRWRDYADWPPAGTRPVALGLSGVALGPATEDALARSFTVDPMDPVPSLGGALCCTGDPETRAGPVDQRPIEGRADLLVYTSPPLAAPLTLAGPLRAFVEVEVDRPDADLVVRLTEVFPDGRSILVQEGSLRLRYRDGFDAPRPMPPGVPQTVEIGLRDTARRIPAGHRLRVHIAGASFPRLARNLHGGGTPQEETEPHLARITIHPGSALVVTAEAPPVFAP